MQMGTAREAGISKKDFPAFILPLAHGWNIEYNFVGTINRGVNTVKKCKTFIAICATSQWAAEWRLS
ncbi:MAG: hypothetical protein LUG27_09590 [Clostridiales bacterium]|nr:hypothetical protein [Clostridiales bacterium]